MPQNLQREQVSGRIVRPSFQPPPVAQVLPPDIRDALVLAGHRRDHVVIDLLTDQAARRGYVRSRHDASRADEWMRLRGLA